MPGMDPERRISATVTSAPGPGIFVTHLHPIQIPRTSLIPADPPPIGTVRGPQPKTSTDLDEIHPASRMSYETLDDPERLCQGLIRHLMIYA
jgi:hypothetical protein